MEKTIVKIYVVVLLCIFTLFSSANGTALFEDNFDDGNEDGWGEYDGVFSVESGAYRLESTGFANDARAVAGDSSWTDYTIDLDFNMVRLDASNYSTSVLFRVTEIASGTDAGKYYQIYMHPDKIGFAEIDYSGGYAQSLIEIPYTIPTQTWNHVQLRIEGEQVMAYINEDFVLGLTGFNKYASGRIGLKTINDGVTLFDNVVVTPEPATVLLIGLGGLLLRRKNKS